VAAEEAKHREGNREKRKQRYIADAKLKKRKTD
jgi:hypothetical protein